MNKSFDVGIHTLGCRVNMYESCVIAERLIEKGVNVIKRGKCDYYIVNTCAVTAESERKSRQLVRRCAKNGKVLVIGCASQLNSTVFSDIPNVIYVGGNREKGAVVDVLCGEKMHINNVPCMDGCEYEDMEFNGTSELFSECRAFIKIQDGCNGKCTYCIIPKCRGKIRSRSSEKIVYEAKRLVANGYSEIILTGIEVSAYNIEPLYSLIERVAAVPGVKRVRLGSLSPNIINEKFLQAVSGLSNFMPHIHLSLQSCSDKVLHDMMRPYRKQDVIDRVKLIRKYIPDCMISADIIVGFPGETEEDYLETESTVKELEIFHVHSFPYSERIGTPAAEMPDSVPLNLRSERNNRLIKACGEIKSKIYNKLIGSYSEVLIEKIVDGIAIGHTGNFIEAKFPDESYNVGQIVKVKIVSSVGDYLYCEHSKEH